MSQRFVSPESVLVRANRRLDLWGELSTLAEAFAAVGTEAQLRERSQHSDEAWTRARSTGSTDPAGFMAYSAPGLLLRDDSWFGQRFLPRAQLAGYLRALSSGDAGRLLRLTHDRDNSDRDASISPRGYDLEGRRLRPGVGVLVRMDPDGPWWRGEVQDAVRRADVRVRYGGSSTTLVRVRPAEVLVRLDTDGLDRWQRADRVLRLRYFVTTKPYATTWDPHSRNWTHGHYEAGEIGLALPRDDHGYWPAGVILHFGSRVFHANDNRVPFLAGLSSETRTYFVPQDQVREIDPDEVREDVDQEGRVLRYLAAPEADPVAELGREERAWSVGSRGGARPGTDAPGLTSTDEDDGGEGRAYEIRDRGTDRESLVFNGLRYSIDLTTDPHESIGWVVEDERGVIDEASAGEAAVVPGARDYVIDRTREAIRKAQERVAEFDFPRRPIRWLQRELDEVVRARDRERGRNGQVAEQRREERAQWARGTVDSPPATQLPSRPAHGRQP